MSDDPDVIRLTINGVTGDYRPGEFGYDLGHQLATVTAANLRLRAALKHHISWTGNCYCDQLGEDAECPVQEFAYPAATHTTP